MKPANDPRHKLLHCELYWHQKHTAVCVNLRAKKICKKNCADFFAWAADNSEVVAETLKKYEPSIKDYLKRRGDEDTDHLKSVMPQGDFICQYCSKPFKVAGKLKSHIKRKHKRELKSQAA